MCLSACRSTGFKSLDTCYDFKLGQDKRLFVEVAAGQEKLKSNKRLFPGTVVFSSAAGKFKASNGIPSGSIPYTFHETAREKVFFEDKVISLKDLLDSKKVSEIWSHGAIVGTPARLPGSTQVFVAEQDVLKQAGMHQFRTFGRQC